ncbi:hypothetical protein [Actinocrispum wychmicini]|uniref:hypothetical protein n=1 Tax=Actinocrispum wychmicini TaxID=1213861 RepID=UPI001405226B|nr:hypothetical protein [Actinocrispum wychmicini]
MTTVLATVALFSDISVQSSADDSTHTEFILSFWGQRILSGGHEESHNRLFIGVTVILEVVVLLAAGLLAIASRRRWAPVVVGALGTGLVITEALSWAVNPLSPDSNITSLRLGWWLIIVAGVVALAALVIALVVRPRPQGYAPPPPRWEPPTPRYGIPVQQAPGAPPPAPGTAPPVSPGTTPSPNPAPAPPSDPGQVAPKLDGDNQ